MPNCGNTSPVDSSHQRSDAARMETYRRLFGYIHPYRYRLLWAMLCGVLLSGTTALAALLVKPVLDQIFIDRDTTKLSWFPLVIVLLYIMPLARRLRLLNRRAQEQLERLSALLAEVFSGLTIVKGFGREAYEQTRFQRSNAAYYRVAMRAVRADELGSPLMECLGAVGIAAVVWYGGHQVMAGMTTPGTFFSFLTAIFMLYEPMRKLSRVNNIIQSAVAAAERAFTVLDTPVEWVGDACKPVLPPMHHGLNFTDVALRNHSNDPLVSR